jgi:hypothetical protein
MPLRINARRGSLMPKSPAIRAGLVYFALVFAAAAVLGAARLLWVAPWLGPRAAEILEMPLMLAVVVFSARWLVGRFAQPAGRAGWLVAGVMAAALVLAADLSLAVYARGLSLDRYLRELDPVTAVPYYGILALCAALPAMLRTRTRRALTSFLREDR